LRLFILEESANNGPMRQHSDRALTSSLIRASKAAEC
jgi:hypothetical protein